MVGLDGDGCRPARKGQVGRRGLTTRDAEGPPIPPAVDRGVVHERAGVVGRVLRDGHGEAAVGEPDLGRDVGPIIVTKIAHLFVVVVPPAVDGAVGEQGAGVVVPCEHGHDGPVPSGAVPVLECDRLDGLAHHQARTLNARDEVALRGAGLGAVGQAIAVVVAVCHEAGRRALGRVVVARQVVGQAVSVVIGQAPQVEREGLGGAAVVRGGHGVGGGRHRSVDRAGDPARGRVDGEVDRKRGRDGPRGRAVGEWWVEADRIDRQVLDHGVGVVRVHAEVQLGRGRVTALAGMDRVGLVEGVDRWSAADGARAAVDGQAGWKGG